MIRCLLLSFCMAAWLSLLPSSALASPGLCTGPVCADGITRSAKNHWQLVMRLNDQQGHREKVVMDCRAKVLSPGLVKWTVGMQRPSAFGPADSLAR